MESIDDVQNRLIPESVYSGHANLRHVTNEIDDIRKAVKEIATRKKKEILESREPKDKKQAPPTSTKVPQGKQDIPEVESPLKKPFLENIKIEFKEGMKELIEFPQFFPTVGLVETDLFHPK